MCDSVSVSVSVSISVCVCVCVCLCVCVCEHVLLVVHEVVDLVFSEAFGFRDCLSSGNSLC